LPGHLLASSLVGWLIFSLGYGALCLIFRGLSNRLSTFQVFMMGAVVYMILTTLCWIVGTIWRAREAHESHPNHHAS
jgi:Na+/melibiose symporter-like transporter